MKKLFSLIVGAVLATISLNAKPYKVAIGIVAGLQEGVGLKVNPIERLTLLEELSYDFVPTAPVAYSGIIDHFNVAYQHKPISGQGIDFSWYAGGGMSIGYVDAFNVGKIGFNAVGGIEANMSNAPIAFTFDFRPGYALLFDATGYANTFDWSLTLGVRYTIPK